MKRITNNNDIRHVEMLYFLFRTLYNNFKIENVNVFRSTCSGVEYEPFMLIIPLSDKILNIAPDIKYINVHVIDLICMEHGFHRIEHIEMQDNVGNSYLKALYEPCGELPVFRQCGLLRYIAPV